ncbi:MAG: hypothetical protein ACI83P_000401 [Janthinobacterium sp.]|jgi:hypothetical protein
MSQSHAPTGRRAGLQRDGQRTVACHLQCHLQRHLQRHFKISIEVVGATVDIAQDLRCAENTGAM